MLNLEFFNRPTNITAKVICDSISEQGVRLTTFEIEYPRFIHGEMMTHRSLSKNSSSSRAIPIQKMFDQINSNTATPLYWGVNKSGMQASEELDKKMSHWANTQWKYFKQDAIENAKTLLEHGNVHKQTVNRLTEPFQMMKVVISGTDFDNFFNLRIHKDAQPEICMLAYKMYKAMEESEPYELKAGQWHLPYCFVSYQGEYDLYSMFYYDEEVGHTCEHIMTLAEAIKYSAARCASVSYRTEDMTLEKADKIFDMLIKAEVCHSSPLEHQATPIKDEQEIENSDYLTIGFVNKTGDPKTWEKGVTHMNKQGQLCSGNLRGFIQYRHLLPNNTNWKFDYNERMKLFS